MSELLPKNDEYYMQLALKEAHHAAHKNEIPIGAVIVLNNTVIAKAYNQTELLHDVTAHAEMIAITTASSFLNSKYLQGCSIYVTIEPCPMCAAAIGWAQIEKLVYGAADEKKGFTKFSNKVLHPKTKVINSILEEECSLLMKDFFKKIRKANK